MSYFHSFTERLEAVKEIKSGYPVSLYCKEHGLCPDQVLEWTRRYDEHGESGLKRHKPYNSISCVERERLVRLYLEKGVPLRQIYTSADISRTNLQAITSFFKNPHSICRIPSTAFA